MNVLLKNTIMLYFFTFSNYFFGLITIPYQTRVLGVESYGELGFASAFFTYFQLVLDFGFMLSATARISACRNSSEKVSDVLSAVIGAKAIISSVLTVIIIVLFLFVERFQTNLLLFGLYYISVVLNSFLPDYVYRGIEKMEIITYRSFFVKLLFTLLVFVFLKQDDQVYLVPLFNILGALFSLVLVYSHVYSVLNFRIKIIPLQDVFTMLKESSGFFFSRVATTLYGATNMFVIGLVYPNGATMGIYSSAEKLISSIRMLASPIADSVYPHMVKEKNFKLIKHILLISTPITLIICIIMYAFSTEICVALFGAEFAAAGTVLRLLLPVVFITLPNYILGFPTLTPLNLTKSANNSTIAGAIVQIVLLVFLLACDIFSVKTICIVTCFSELIVLLYRVFSIILYKKRNKNK